MGTGPATENGDRFARRLPNASGDDVRRRFARCARQLRLTDRQAGVVYMRAIEGLSIPTVARRMGISVTVVKSHFRAAAAKIGETDIVRVAFLVGLAIGKST